MSRELVFMRIPKTASGSVTAALRRKRVTVIGHDLRDPHYEPLASYRERAAREVFAFAFVRNPWDRLVSAFFYLVCGGSQPADRADRDRFLGAYGEDFEAFVHGAFDAGAIFGQLHFRPQFEWIADRDGALVTDFVGRFENLQADFDRVCKLTGLWRKRLGYQKRGQHAHYRSYYTPAMRDIVASAYRRDLELFDYTF